MDSPVSNRRWLILLVEDNPADVYLLKEALRAHDVGFELEWLQDGEQAVLWMAEGRIPDLIVLDLNLPRVDGKEVLARLRNLPQFGRCPVVVMTSSDSPEDRAETTKLGADGYIKKPPTLDEFLAVGGMLKEIVAGHR